VGTVEGVARGAQYFPQVTPVIEGMGCNRNRIEKPGCPQLNTAYYYYG
jgi:hypothetical protein